MCLCACMCMCMCAYVHISVYIIKSQHRWRLKWVFFLRKIGDCCNKKNQTQLLSFTILYVHNKLSPTDILLKAHPLIPTRWLKRIYSYVCGYWSCSLCPTTATRLLILHHHFIETLQAWNCFLSICIVIH